MTYLNEQEMKPFPFQEECITELIDKFAGRGLLSAEMGLGKTLMSLSVAGRLEAWPVVVVCPASLKWNWQQEVRKVLDMRSHILEGRKPEPAALLQRHKILILNYDILAAWLPVLRELKPRCVILDECQYIANPSTKRTKAVKQLCRHVKHVMALSGTPLINRPIELYPVLNLLANKVFRSRFTYGKTFCNGRRSPWGWDFTGRSNTKELNTLLLQTCMVRRRKADVLHDLPPKIRQVHPLPMRDREQYQKAVDDFIGWLEENDPKKATAAKKAEVLVQTGALLRLAAKLKFRGVVDWINQFLADNPEEKIVVFAVHRKMIEALLRRISLPAVRIDGSVAGRDRQTAVQRFQGDKNCRVFVGNIQAAGVGLTLTAASHVAFTELSWRPGDHIQAEDRCHRIGATGTVWAHYLVAYGSIESRLCRVLQAKQGTISAILDGGRTEEDLDVFDQLLEEVKKVKK